jgi:hypothetical protein
MVNLADALKAEPPISPGAVVVEKRTRSGTAFTMDRLRSLAVWGAAAAGALLFAVLTSRSEVAAERLAVVLHRPSPAAAAPFDAEAATDRLAEAVRGLSVNDEQIRTRLAAVEHDMDDVTGSVSKEIKAADESRRTPDGPSVAAVAALTASMAAPVEIPTGAANASPPATIKASDEAAAPALSRTAFGVDIGSGLTIQALRMRWVAIRTSYPQLFSGLQPIMSVKEIPRSNRLELRLVAGPIAQPGEAARLCAAMARLGMFCQPTIYDGQHLADRQ